MSENIANGKVKGKDCIGVAVVYFCHDGKGNFVMSKRGENTRDEQGRWDIGGGALEFGEKVEETLRKEIKEEYGTDVIQYEFIGFREVDRGGKDAKTHWIALDYKVLVDPAKVKNGEPHKFDEVSWFTRESMPPDSSLHSQLTKFISLHKHKIF